MYCKGSRLRLIITENVTSNVNRVTNNFLVLLWVGGRGAGYRVFSI